MSSTVPSRSSKPEIRLGLRNNLPQFALLVIINAFVGAMVGLERSILPAIAEREFQLAARTAVLSFIVVFGVTKAMTNYFAGRWCDASGRKRVLVAGWFVASPVPFLLMWAPSWSWVLWANALLGVSQGLTWSTTVIMTIDLVGAQRRGLAMGLNEFAGYVAVAGAALFPLVFAAANMSIEWIGTLAAIYPGVWGVVQLGTGAMSDRIGRKALIVGGMWTQALAIIVVIFSTRFPSFAIGLALLGIGTAMVYPTLLAAIGDVAHPSWRASSVGIYRLWRDLGTPLARCWPGLPPTS